MSNVHNTKCYLWQPHRGLTVMDIESWDEEDPEKFTFEGMPTGGKIIVAVGPGDGTCSWKDPENNLFHGTLEQFESIAHQLWEEIYTEYMNELAEKLVAGGALDLLLDEKYPDGFPMVQPNGAIAAWVTRDDTGIMRELTQFAQIALAMYQMYKTEELP